MTNNNSPTDLSFTSYMSSHSKGGFKIGKVTRLNNEKLEQKVQEFLCFVQFSIILKVIPLFESLTNNSVFQIMIGLTVIAIIIKTVPITKLSFYLQAQSEHFRINLNYLYAIYIIPYIWVFYVFLERRW